VNIYIAVGTTNTTQSRRLRWTEQVLYMEEKRNAYEVLVGKPEGKKHLQDPGIDGRMILE